MSTVPAAPTPVTVFYSYAHEDEAFRENLQDHLKILERRGLLAPWHDRKIVPGANWAQAIDQHLQSAELVMLLISSSFIASDYIWGRELEVAMQRNDAKEATVVPIFVRAVDLDGEDVPFMRLQGLPTDLRPVTSWPNIDEAWANVAKGLRKTVQEILARRPPAPPVPASRGLQRAAVPASRRPPAAAAQALQGDAVLERVIDRFSSSVNEVAVARGGVPGDAEVLRSEALQLIDRPETTRVLWVDDRPPNNVGEVAALAKLQVEVVFALSTEEAQRQLATDPEPFDIVISDWSRPAEGRDAGLRLLDWLREQHPALPLVFYHGEFNVQRRARRAERALAHGALGEAVLPGELISLVLQALPR